MGDGLKNTEEHQADTDTGSEQHRKPFGVAVAGHRIQPAKTDSSQRGHADPQAEHDEQVRRTEKEPVERRRGPRPQAGEYYCRLVQKQQGTDYDGQHQSRGDDEYRVVDVQTQDLDVVLADLMTDIG